MREFKELNKNIIATTVIKTKLGELFVAGNKEGILMLAFYDKSYIETKLEKLKKFFDAEVIPGICSHFTQLEIQLNEYFENKREEFTIPIKLIGSPFQIKVWKELLKIPYGQTISYKEQATNIGKPTAFRAVANANAQNSLMILVPCHRVISSSGKLSGYAGGVSNKAALLKLEKSNFL